MRCDNCHKQMGLPDYIKVIYNAIYKRYRCRHCKYEVIVPVSGSRMMREYKMYELIQEKISACRDKVINNSL